MFKNALLAVVLGSAAFFFAIGINALNPCNIGWLLDGDHYHHYIGWAFFRQSSWQLPLGANPYYGLDISSSIVFSDSLPIFAIPFKLLSIFLPVTFQYFGIWLLTCLILQAYFSLKLLEIFLNDTTALIFSVCLFIFSPAMLWRVSEHLALAGHFAIVAALYYSLSPNGSAKVWKNYALLAVSLLIHFYIAFMVCGIWFASLLDRMLVKKTITLKTFVLELCGSVVLLVTVGWLAGYFMIAFASTGGGGFGDLGMNGLSIFYSKGWSHFQILSDVYQDYEGYNYLGLGILLGLPVLLFYVLRSSALFNFIKNQPCLCLFLFILLCLAVTNKPKFGTFAFEFAIPEYVSAAVSVVRASGRLFWPLYYLLILAIVLSITRVFRAKIAWMFLFFMACFNIYDTSAGFLFVKKNFIDKHPSVTQDNWKFVSVFKSPFWQQAGQKYQNIILVPTINQGSDWESLSAFALNHGMGTNAVKFGRIDQVKVSLANNQFISDLNEDALSDNNLYILGDWKLNPDFRLVLPSSKHYLGLVDGFMVLAPNWFLLEMPMLTGMSLPQMSYPFVPANQMLIGFGNQEAGRIYLKDGWHALEPWGVWSSREKSHIMLPMPIKGSQRLHLNLRAMPYKEEQAQELRILIDGKLIGVYKLTNAKNNLINIPIAKLPKNKTYIEVEFDVNKLTTPKNMGNANQDNRMLGIGLVSASFE